MHLTFLSPKDHLQAGNNQPLRAILRKFKPQNLSRLYNHLNTHEVPIFTEALMRIHKIYGAMHQFPKDRILFASLALKAVS